MSPWHFIGDTCDSKITPESSTRRFLPFLPPPPLRDNAWLLQLLPWGSHILWGGWSGTKPISPCRQPLPAEITGTRGKLIPPATHSWPANGPIAVCVLSKCLTNPQRFSPGASIERSAEKENSFTLPVCSGWCLPTRTMLGFYDSYLSSLFFALFLQTVPHILLLPKNWVWPKGLKREATFGLWQTNKKSKHSF